MLHRRRLNEGMGGAQEQSSDSVAYRLQVYMNRGHQGFGCFQTRMKSAEHLILVADADKNGEEIVK